jgi:hypothetical protein
MRILAASFETVDAATRALQALGRRFDTATSLEIAPLGHAGRSSGPGMVLAGRFEEDVIEAVRVAVRELGGTVVVDREQRSI